MVQSQAETNIEDALRDLLPFMEAAHGDALFAHGETDLNRLLRSFYLFKVSSAVLPDDVEDIQGFIEQRYRSVLSATHRADWTVLTAIIGSSSGVSLYFGFMPTQADSSADPDVFERILQGLLPGLALDLEETLTVEALVGRKRFGGMLSGVPVLKIDDERQYFNLSSVVRSLHGETYTLLFVSRPVRDNDLSIQLNAVFDIRDKCHTLATQMWTKVSGGGKNWQTSQTEGTMETDSRYGKAIIGGMGGAVIGALGGPQGAAIGAGVGASLILAASGQHSTSKTDTRTYGGESHWSESLSGEQQVTVALELERIAERHTDRLMKAANVGQWETAITFATETAAGRDVLTGALLGELAKPSTDVYPPRIHHDDLTNQRPLLLPKYDHYSAVFPKSLASYLTSEELASIAAPPCENLPGYEIRRTPALSLTDIRSFTSSEGRSLGNVCAHGRPLEGVEVRLSSTDLAKHLFVCGLTGSGKTTTVKEILAALDVPFLVLESAKRDYRQLLGCPSLKGPLRIYTPGDTSIAPLRLNPFHIMPGVPAGVHIDYLKAIFNASFSLYGPMPYIVEKCLHNIYLKRGWNLTSGKHPQLLDADGQPDKQRYDKEESRCYFPTLLDLRDEVQKYVRSLDYKGELSDNIRAAIITRLDSLAVGAKGLLFNTSKPLDIEDLLAKRTVLELDALSDDDDKAFVVGLLLTLISEYRQTNDPSRNPFAKPERDLQHVLVIEEAHRLLKNVVQERQTEHLGNPRGKAVEFFANVISEMRSMGQGVAVVEQIPSKLLPDVIKNTNTKIVHRLVSHDDQALLASTLGLEEQEAIYLTSLQTGHALYAKEGMQRPIEVKIKQTVSPQRISDDRVKKEMEPKMAADDEANAMAVRQALGPAGYALVLRFLCTVACGDSSESSVYVREAMAQLKALLLKRDYRFPEPGIKKFLSTGVVELLANGQFRLADGKVQGIIPLIARLLDGDNQAGASFRKRLARGWHRDARDGAIHRIRELALERARARRVRSALDASVVNRIVETYFIADIPAVHEIASQVIKRLGGSTWPP